MFWAINSLVVASVRRTRFIKQRWTGRLISGGGVYCVYNLVAIATLKIPELPYWRH